MIGRAVNRNRLRRKILAGNVIGRAADARGVWKPVRFADQGDDDVLVIDPSLMDSPRVRVSVGRDKVLIVCLNGTVIYELALRPVNATPANQEI